VPSNFKRLDWLLAFSLWGSPQTQGLTLNDAAREHRRSTPTSRCAHQPQTATPTNLLHTECTLLEDIKHVRNRKALSMNLMQVAKPIVHCGSRYLSSNLDGLLVWVFAKPESTNDLDSAFATHTKALRLSRSAPHHLISTSKTHAKIQNVARAQLLYPTRAHA
jgi:hypothetical protein